jgi:hypothetical protein
VRRSQSGRAMVRVVLEWREAVEEMARLRVVQRAGESRGGARLLGRVVRVLQRYASWGRLRRRAALIAERMLQAGRLWATTDAWDGWAGLSRMWRGTRGRLAESRRRTTQEGVLFGWLWCVRRCRRLGVALGRARRLRRQRGLAVWWWAAARSREARTEGLRREAARRSAARAQWWGVWMEDVARGLERRAAAQELAGERRRQAMRSLIEGWREAAEGLRRRRRAAVRAAWFRQGRERDAMRDGAWCWRSWAGRRQAVRRGMTQLAMRRAAVAGRACLVCWSGIAAALAALCGKRAALCDETVVRPAGVCGGVSTGLQVTLEFNGLASRRAAGRQRAELLQRAMGGMSMAADGARWQKQRAAAMVRRAEQRMLQWGLERWRGWTGSRRMLKLIENRVARRRRRGASHECVGGWRTVVELRRAGGRRLEAVRRSQSGRAMVRVVLEWRGAVEEMARLRVVQRAGESRGGARLLGRVVRVLRRYASWGRLRRRAALIAERMLQAGRLWATTDAWDGWAGLSRMWRGTRGRLAESRRRTTQEGVLFGWLWCVRRCRRLGVALGRARRLRRQRGLAVWWWAAARSREARTEGLRREAARRSAARAQWWGVWMEDVARGLERRAAAQELAGERRRQAMRSLIEGWREAAEGLRRRRRAAVRAAWFRQGRERDAMRDGAWCWRSWAGRRQAVRRGMTQLAMRRAAVAGRACLVCWSGIAAALAALCGKRAALCDETVVRPAGVCGGVSTGLQVTLEFNGLASRRAAGRQRAELLQRAMGGMSMAADGARWQKQRAAAMVRRAEQRMLQWGLERWRGWTGSRRMLKLIENRVARRRLRGASHECVGGWRTVVELRRAGGRRLDPVCLKRFSFFCFFDWCFLCVLNFFFHHCFRCILLKRMPGLQACPIIIYPQDLGYTLNWNTAKVSILRITFWFLQQSNMTAKSYPT